MHSLDPAELAARSFAVLPRYVQFLPLVKGNKNGFVFHYICSSPRVSWNNCLAVKASAKASQRAFDDVNETRFRSTLRSCAVARATGRTQSLSIESMFRFINCLNIAGALFTFQFSPCLIVIALNHAFLRRRGEFQRF
jgi:hypothetical protein